MACCRGAKRPIEFLLNQLSSRRQPRHGYSSWACRGNQVSVVKDVYSPISFVQSDFKCPSGSLIFMRRFSVEVPASEQMNLIKQLRERTSAPIKDVKSSLVNCNWDIEAAQKDLRKRGVVLASKKSSRTAAEGLLAVAQNEKKAVVIELNCETDFVARNEIFQCLALSLARNALSIESSPQQLYMASPLGIEILEGAGLVHITFKKRLMTISSSTWQGMKVSLDHPKLSGETTVQSAIAEVAAMVGENVKLRRGFVLSTSSHGVVSSYLHTSPQPGLGRIAGILSLEAENDVPLDALQRVGSSLAMHIVAAKPLFLSKELVSSEALESERDILKSQAETSGKSQMAIDKMVEGRLRKYLEEVVLLEQKFVVNDSINVKSVLNDLSKEVDSPVTIGKFFRMEVGEGIDRVEASGAPEVAAQAV
ncbi:elongation factor Ts, mitochondrial isoform X1 [Cinnamomum micranthum f. kanehirae]|uniref:Elongation factor Ts, mitochondrial n=1 Tax=Cinnamomum micranthum f. kanehirae TaxID=337451 RepID=A0A3S3PN37_9MAGN|nr:elongation factor Ts, mitochondrial isoform X1 [Cinnamomum micranthum f. kanehirae]